MTDSAGGWMYFAQDHGIDPIRFRRDVFFKQLADDSWVIKPKDEVGELGVIVGLKFVYIADDRG